jgi:hypothetical protein
MQEIEQPSRRLMVVSTAVTGLFIVIGLIIAVYASEYSRSASLSVYGKGTSARWPNKDDNLFGPLLIQFFFFLVLVYHCIIWKRFIPRGIEQTAAYNARYSLKTDLAHGLRLVCYGVICMDAFVLSIVVYYSIQILNA